jgi:hypothetical protein
MTEISKLGKFFPSVKKKKKREEKYWIKFNAM